MLLVSQRNYYYHPNYAEVCPSFLFSFPLTILRGLYFAKEAASASTILCLSYGFDLDNFHKVFNIDH